MKTRLAGFALILIGALFAVFFIYLPIRNGGTGFMGPLRIKALVFVPLALVAGASFVIGGPTALGAFQARPKSRKQLAFVLAVIIGSGVLTALSYWQIKTRWLRPPEQEIIRDTTNWSPRLPPPRAP